ncbi:MAG: GNAT family N-acetyltransferase [Nocardioides sp.]|uniref:GNAT family N-acetyltransferase n=1 Tax=Nocardioides sp. TaxID=35761 RepID=UPI00239B4B05|nr:GNAT family N-acetyltransferase [Nocardioides sp.]MDE0775601.1 GNAT family N-acetyltransferase [Nocardioides sp.]
MLWRVRTTLPDRPGTLAALADECGRAEVNILGLQVFPGGGQVTDELVLSTPDDWDDDRLVALLGSAGGQDVNAQRCTEDALSDQPTRYVQAARAVLAQPASFPDVVAHLFDADVAPASDVHDVMEMSVADVLVQIRRVAPFTATEHARGAAMAELVSDVLGRERPAFSPSGGRRMGSGATPTYAVRGSTVVAMADGTTVGLAVVHPPEDDSDVVRTIDIDVDAAWQRRGIGTRLLGDSARLARRLGAEEIILTTAHDNRAVLPMVLAAGMRGRIRMAGETLTVRIAVRELKPLAE